MPFLKKTIHYSISLRQIWIPDLWDYAIAQIYFKKKWTNLFNGLEYARAYIDDLFTFSNKPFEDHINKLYIVWHELKQKVSKEMQKSPFSPEMKKLEYLGFRISRQSKANTLTW